MKQLRLLLGIVLVAALAFNGCKKDDEDAVGPSISFFGGDYIDADATVEPGTVLTFSWLASKGDADMVSFTIMRDGIDLSGYPDEEIDKESYKDSVSITAPANEGDYVYTFKVTDKDGLSVTKEFTITVEGEAPAPTGTPFASTKTGQFYHAQGSLQGAYDLTSDANVASSATAPMQNTDAVGAAFTGSWKAEDATTYVKSSSYDYTTGYKEDAATAFAAGTASATVTNPVVGDIYIAKSGSVYMAIKITALDANDNTCNCTNKGKITFEYKKD